jgi:DNA-binding Lrp family transcriptional regulator
VSNKAVKWAYEKVQTVDATAKTVLVCLADHANLKGESWPGVQLICQKTGLKERTVRYALRRLESLGTVSREARYVKSKRQRSAIYRLKLNRQFVPQPPASDAPTPGTSCPTILDPPFDPSSELPEAPEKTGAIDPGLLIFSDEESKANLEKLMKAGDLLSQLTKEMTEEQVITKAKSKGSPSSLRLSQLWKDLHAVHKVEVYVGPISPKEQGQFTQLAKLLAGLDACYVMSTVIRDWVPFGKFLKEQGVVYDFPDRPHVGFLLKHGLMAGQFYEKDALQTTLGAVNQSEGLKPYIPECN